VLGLLAQLEPEAVYATALYVRLCPATGELVLSSAGHPPALLRSAGGDVAALEATGVPIGASGGRPHRDVTARLDPGDVLVIVTDGVIERRGEIITQGLDRLVRLTADAGAGAAEELAERISRELCGVRDDDCCIVVVRRRPD
jgi:serine phosphatase RsbU (regulator of sigma subunit)